MIRNEASGSRSKLNPLQTFRWCVVKNGTSAQLRRANSAEWTLPNASAARGPTWRKFHAIKRRLIKCNTWSSRNDFSFMKSFRQPSLKSQSYSFEYFAKPFWKSSLITPILARAARAMWKLTRSVFLPLESFSTPCRHFHTFDTRIHDALKQLPKDFLEKWTSSSKIRSLTRQKSYSQIEP